MYTFDTQLIIRTYACQNLFKVPQKVTENLFELVITRTQDNIPFFYVPSGEITVQSQ